GRPQRGDVGGEGDGRAWREGHDLLGLQELARLLGPVLVAVAGVAEAAGAGLVRLARVPPAATPAIDDDCRVATAVADVLGGGEVVHPEEDLRGVGEERLVRPVRPAPLQL